MGLAEALQKTTLPNKTACPAGRLINSMEKADKEALLKALDSGVAGRHIVLALRMEGYKISPEALSNHRKKRCQCETTK